jgi:hypothetical protein
LDQKLTRRMWFVALASSVFGGWAATRAALEAEQGYRYTGKLWHNSDRLMYGRMSICDPSVGRWKFATDESERSLEVTFPSPGGD